MLLYLQHNKASEITQMMRFDDDQADEGKVHEKLEGWKFSFCSGACAAWSVASHAEVWLVPLYMHDCFLQQVMT